MVISREKCSNLCKREVE